jgi:putative membrane protein
MHTAKSDRPIWKGLVAGVAAGAVAAWTMTQFQTGLMKLQKSVNGDGEQSDSSSQAENATIKAAEALTEPVIERKLTGDEKKTAGPIVHYAFGTGMGAAYGALAEATPVAAAGRGLLFGTALWFGADEVAVPALGLSKPPLTYPPSTHLNALAAHLVYGLTTDVVRRAVLRAL